MKINFTDSVEFNFAEKTALSVRDGVIEYYGSELNIEPFDKVFTVYRSPATIANVAAKMIGIPLTDEHVEVGVPVKNPIGVIDSAEMVDAFSSGLDSTLAIKNRISVKDEFLPVIELKREMSLGYEGELIKHDKCDFEQINLDPHHLASVKKGRNGSICSFIDKQKEEKVIMEKRFFKDDGSFNLQEFVEIIQALPEAAKRVPVEQLTEIIPQLRAIVNYTEEATGETVVEASTDESLEVEKKALDEEKKALDEDKEKFEDEKKNFSDSATFKDQVAKLVSSGVKETITVIEKAKQFLPPNYVFTDKSTVQIMRDTIKTQHNESFLDSELPTAFKLLKPQSKHLNFGDSVNTNNFESMGNKEY